jgi:hypothetical protein
MKKIFLLLPILVLLFLPYCDDESGSNGQGPVEIEGSWFFDDSGDNYFYTLSVYGDDIVWLLNQTNANNETVYWGELETYSNSSNTALINWITFESTGMAEFKQYQKISWNIDSVTGNATVNFFYGNDDRATAEAETLFNEHVYERKIPL